MPSFSEVLLLSPMSTAFLLARLAAWINTVTVIQHLIVWEQQLRRDIFPLAVVTGGTHQCLTLKEKRKCYSPHRPKISPKIQQLNKSWVTLSCDLLFRLSLGCVVVVASSSSPSLALSFSLSKDVLYFSHKWGHSVSGNADTLDQGEGPSLN